MNSIDRNYKEKKKIIEWASACHVISPPFRLEGVTSYFSSFDNKENIIHYGFTRLPELENMLHKMWEGVPQMDGIYRTCAVSAFKNKKNHGIDHQNHIADVEDKEMIPEFVYVF